MNGAVRLSWAEVNDIGMRTENQDSVGIARSGAMSCFVVADGTGGHLGGALASRLLSASTQASRKPVSHAGA